LLNTTTKAIQPKRNSFIPEVFIAFPTKRPFWRICQFPASVHLVATGNMLRILYFRPEVGVNLALIQGVFLGHATDIGSI